MDFLTDEIIERAIRSQQDTIFDSHAIFFTLMTDYPRDYAGELYECLEYEPDPFVKLHTDITKRMASKDFSHVVRKHSGKRTSLNCRGKEDECQVWQRLVGTGQIPNENNTNVAQSNDDFAHLKVTVMRNLAFFVAKQGSSQVRRGAPIYRQNPKVPNEEKSNFWNAISNRLNELAEGMVVQAFAIPQHVQMVVDFADFVTNHYADILHNDRFRIGVAQKVVGLYLKYSWLTHLIQEPTVCPFDGIIIKKVLGLSYRWTHFDTIQMYQEIVDAALIHANEHGFGNHLSRWELFMYQQFM